MATKNKVNITSDIVAEIRTGNSDTTAAGLRTILYEILDSYVNVKDGGHFYETPVGYNGLLTLTDPKSFVYKQWVENYVSTNVTLASVLGNDNKTGGFDITSGDGNSVASILNGYIFLYSGTVNSGKLYLGEDGADLYNVNGGFYVTEGLIITPNYFQVKTTANTIKHTIKNVFNSPINEFTNGGVYFVSGIGIDTTATAGSDILNIGATNANVINYGNASTIHNFLGTAIYELQVNSYVEDKLITLNYGGAIASGIGVGFEIEEAGVITGFLKTNAGRDGYSFQAPSIVHTAHILFNSFTADRTFNLPDNSGTLAIESFVTSGYVPYSGATQDTDLGAWSLNAKSLNIKGTGGTGHLGLKHQSAGITASASESSLGADVSGNPVWKNDGNAIDNLELQSNKTSTIVGNETNINKYTNTKAVADYVNLFIGAGTTTDLGVVISRINTPPASPVTGDRYLVDTSPTGVWVGNSDKIATWGGASYTYITPINNNTVFITATLTTLRFNGTSWVAFQGTAILQNGNTLGVAMSIGTNDNFDVNFKRNGTNQWAINSNGFLVRTTGGKTTSLNDGFAIFTDSATSGLPGIQFTQTVTNNRISVLGRWGQTGGGVFTGTSISSNDVLQVSNGGASSDPYPVLTRGSVLYNIVGHTGTNIGTRLDATGLRIGAINTLHTANTVAFQVGASLTYNTSTGVFGNTLSVNGNLSYQNVNASTGASATAMVQASNKTTAATLFQFGTNYATSGLFTANLTALVAGGGVGLLYANTAAGTYHKWSIGGTAAANEVMNLDINGLSLSTVGMGLKIKEGTNATMGVATLVGGTVVVSTTKVTANSRIQLTIQSLGTVTIPTTVGVTARTGGTSFTITSANVSDTSVIAWQIIEPI